MIMKKKSKAIAAKMLMISILILAGCNKSEEPVDDWVDLGLPSGLLWATRNVGATMPEDHGDYFAWGETQPKNKYDYISYKYIIYLPHEEFEVLGSVSSHQVL